MPNFDQLVGQLQEEETERQLGITRSQVRPVLDRIRKALETIPLDESKVQQLFEIVNKAFEEANIPLLRKEKANPRDGQEDQLAEMGSCIAGVYPTSAYNVEIYADKAGLVAFIWPVPKTGNLRS